MADKKFKNTDDETLPFIVPGWVNWIAQDESGAWWGYSVEPLRNDHGWYENEVGEYLHLGVSEPVNWRHSLLRTHVD